MIYFQGTTSFYMAGPTAVTLGKFDGVHKGHQKLLEHINAYARRHPDAQRTAFVLNGKGRDLILTAREQKEVFERFGMDCLIRCPFTPDIYLRTPENFVKEILADQLHVSYVVVGTDFRFGHDRAGDAAFLMECSSRYGFEVEVIEKETYGGRAISSTYVREAVREGDMQLFFDLTGRAFSIGGRVVPGRQLGTRIGMPTANLIPEEAKLLPPNGVYFSRTLLGGSWYEGVTNIGCKPTVGGTFTGAETYLFGIDRPLYGEELRVELLRFTRPENKFGSVDELKEQIARDLRAGEEYFRLQFTAERM